MLKILGMIMVIAACSLTGFELASKAGRKKENLISLKNGIDAMEREVMFSKNPLCEIFKKASECIKEPVSELFLSVGSEIEKNPYNAEIIWSEALESNAGRLCFTKTDVRMLKGVFSGMGKTDSISQKKILSAAAEKVNAIAEDYKSVCDKNTKLYRNMGVLLGIFIAVLFI